MKNIHRYATGLTALATFILDPLAASADTFQATRSEKLVEKSHKIDIQIGHGHADLRVRRTVHNGGPRHDQATFYIDMPHGAVAVGLRTLGMMDGKPHWFDGELMEAEAAAAKYRELTGIGGYYPKDPALLSWRNQSRLALQVFPCAPGEDKTIEYTLRIPTEYRDGRHHLNLSLMGTDSLYADATISAMQTGESVYLDDKPAGARAWVHLDRDIDVSVAPVNVNALEGALASISINGQKNLVEYHIEAAPKLGTVPVGARIVVLVDASRSVDDDDLATQFAMTQAYVTHFPEGRVAIVPFNRKARASSPGFVSVGQARTALKSMTIERKNGSNVDEALATADVMLAAEPASAAKRVVLLTDGRTRASLTPEMLKGKLQKSGALLHIGILSGAYQTSVDRYDAHDWNVATRPTGGLVWEASLNTYNTDAKRDESIFEEWARPKRIDHFAVRHEGSTQPSKAFSDKLDEGQGIDELDLMKAGVESIEVTGELWATPVRKVFNRDKAEEQRWAGLFFGTHLYSSISEAEMMPLAMLGKAVSPVTSYLAIEPGVRPSTEGLEESGVGFGSAFGSGLAALAGGRATGTVVFSLDKNKFLRDALENGLSQCGGKGRKASATLETTQAEIVSVQVSIDGEKAGSKLANCFDEAAWNIYLVDAFRDEQAVYTISL